jgi:hypothetical protein
VHLVCRAFSLALLNTGNNIAANMATMAMTTNNSISVKPLRIPITLLACIESEASWRSVHWTS